MNSSKQKGVQYQNPSDLPKQQIPTALRKSRGLLNLGHKLFELPQRESLRARVGQTSNLQLLSKADLQQQAHSFLKCKRLTPGLVARLRHCCRPCVNSASCCQT